jgi:tRNA threonylcarbamoyladenosine biosynthesis protein TsaB
MTVTLAIVACGPQLEVALQHREGEVASLVRLAGGSPRSTLLLAAADLLVDDAGLDPSAVERVVISRGPGSFTGIRSGIATAQGLEGATGAAVVAYDSLLVQAARCGPTALVWSAQPGRRGEVYARAYAVDGRHAPEPMTEIEVLSVEGLRGRGPWIAAEGLDLHGAERAAPERSAAEALITLFG